jgi:asparagine synthase (glutamine-hydrolysing)
MGAMVAVVSKKRESAYDTAVIMLEALKHRGSDSFGVASQNEVAIKKALAELRGEHIDSDMLIGHILNRLLPTDTAQPVHMGKFALVFEGRLFPTSDMEDAIRPFSEKLACSEEGAARLIQTYDGSYVFAIAGSKRVLVGRDTVGTCPLYFGESKDFCAMASERRALRRVGIVKIDCFPPGTVALVDKTGFHFKTAKIIALPPKQRMAGSNAASLLETALLQSTKERVSDVEEVVVAFSGGIDSSLIALLAKLCKVRTHLVYVTLEDERETVFVRQAAETLGLPLHIAEYTLKDVAEVLPKVLWLIEEPNPVNASIAIPVFWVAEQASKLGLRVLLAGQGADELFGGYRRYIDNLMSEGVVNLRRQLYDDVVSLHETNFQRDSKVCAFHQVELRTPFSDLEVIELALRIPVEMKIASPMDRLRKGILRQTASNLGIPDFIAEKPKRAIQYATGVNNAIRKLAKRERLTMRGYVEKLFAETRNELSPDG